MFELLQVSILDRAANRINVGSVVIDKNLAKKSFREFNRLLAELSKAVKSPSTDRFQALSEQGISLKSHTDANQKPALNEIQLLWSQLRFITGKLTGRFRYLIGQFEKMEQGKPTKNYKKAAVVRDAFADLQKIAQEGWTPQTQQALRKAFSKHPVDGHLIKLRPGLALIKAQVESNDWVASSSPQQLVAQSRTLLQKHIFPNSKAGNTTDFINKVEPHLDNFRYKESSADNYTAGDLAADGVDAAGTAFAAGDLVHHLF